MRRETAALFALAVLMASCGSASGDRTEAGPSAGPAETATEPPTPRPTRSGLHRPQPAEVYDIEHFDSVRQLVRRADLVMIGTVTGGRWGHEYRDVEVDESGTDVEVARDLVYDLHIDEVIKGRAVGRKPDSVSMVIDLVDLPYKLDPPVGEQAVFFLRRIGARVPGHDLPEDPLLLGQRLYRPVSSLGILDLDRGRPAFTLGGGADWVPEFLKSSWDDAIARIEDLADD